jgi:hypothetical protein
MCSFSPMCWVYSSAVTKSPIQNQPDINEVKNNWKYHLYPNNVIHRGIRILIEYSESLKFIAVVGIKI